jgi:hypothetical protein
MPVHFKIFFILKKFDEAKLKAEAAAQNAEMYELVD